MQLHLCSINSLSPVKLIKFIDSFSPYRNPLWSFGVFTMVYSCYHNTDPPTPCLQSPGQWHTGGNASLKVQWNLHKKQKAQATMLVQWSIVVSPGNCASSCCIGKCSRLTDMPNMIEISLWACTCTPWPLLKVQVHSGAWSNLHWSIENSYLDRANNVVYSNCSQKNNGSCIKQWLVSM